MRGMRTLTFLFSFSLLCACADPNRPRTNEPPPRAQPVQASQPAQSSGQASTAAPSSAKPAASPESKVAAAPHGQSVLRFVAQAGWVEEPTSSAMRVGQYRLPKLETDAEDATLIVYHFGAAGGGGFEANLERWASQMEQPDGSDSASKIAHLQRKHGEVALHEAWLDGTLVAETMPGSGERLNKPGFRLRAAMLEVPGTTAYYAKLTGPKATVERWEASWNAFLTSAAQSHSAPVAPR